LQTKIEKLQLINQSLREKKRQGEGRYISSLSDQLLVLSERIYTTVRKKTIDLSLKNFKRN
jgi:hypothetical protein